MAEIEPKPNNQTSTEKPLEPTTDEFLCSECGEKLKETLGEFADGTVYDGLYCPNGCHLYY